MREFTACIKCKHYDNRAVRGFNADIWYNHYCLAAPCKEVRDTHSGKMTWEGGNSHRYCRDINADGVCERYEESDGIIARFVTMIKGKEATND